MVGQTVSHYKIPEKLGSGGMGDVYKAEDTKLHRYVALKLLASHLLQDEDASKRFHREAQAAAALSHPNITMVHEIGRSRWQDIPGAGVPGYLGAWAAPGVRLGRGVRPSSAARS